MTFLIALARYVFDKGTPISIGPSGCIAASGVFPKLMTASVAVLRWYEWPYDYSRDAEESLAGLKEAHDLVGHIRGKLDRLAFD